MKFLAASVQISALVELGIKPAAVPGTRKLHVGTSFRLSPNIRRILYVGCGKFLVATVE